MQPPLKLLFLVVVSLMLMKQTASATDKDYEMWLSVRATKAFKFDLDLGVEQQVRLFEQREIFSEFFANYEILKFLNFGTEFRFKFVESEPTAYRIAPYMMMEFDKKDLEMNYQIKYQINFSKFDNPQKTLRNKIATKYKINKKWRLNTALELFTSQNENVFYLEKFRWTLGTRYKINKLYTLQWFYGIERNRKFNNPEIRLTHITGIRWNIKW